MSKRLELELVRSIIGTPRWMRAIVRGVGLRKLRDKVVVPDNDAMRGVVRKVPHLVNMKEVEG